MWIDSEPHLSLRSLGSSALNLPLHMDPPCRYVCLSQASTAPLERPRGSPDDRGGKHDTSINYSTHAPAV